MNDDNEGRMANSMTTNQKRHENTEGYKYMGKVIREKIKETTQSSWGQPKTQGLKKTWKDVTFSPFSLGSG